MRKYLVLTLCALLGAVSLTACGKKETATTTEATTTEATTEATEATTEEKTKATTTEEKTEATTEQKQATPAFEAPQWLIGTWRYDGPARQTQTQQGIVDEGHYTTELIIRENGTGHITADGGNWGADTDADIVSLEITETQVFGMDELGYDVWMETEENGSEYLYIPSKDELVEANAWPLTKVEDGQ